MVVDLDQKPDFNTIKALMLQNRLMELPEPLAPKGLIVCDFTMQLVILPGQAEGKWMVLKHFEFADKIFCDVAKSVTRGQAMTVNWGTNIRLGRKAFSSC